ncbi:hypothetical protein [Vibrio phage RYC]|nr:hypothetical protein [Vibrio phage RYC]
MKHEESVTYPYEGTVWQQPHHYRLPEGCHVSAGLSKPFIHIQGYESQFKVRKDAILGYIDELDNKTITVSTAGGEYTAWFETEDDFYKNVEALEHVLGGCESLSNYFKKEKECVPEEERTETIHEVREGETEAKPKFFNTDPSSEAYKDGFALGSRCNIGDKFDNPYVGLEPDRWNFAQGFDHAILDRLS